METDAAPLQLQLGQVLARDYRVLRALAAGGMGSVYLVEQLSTGKQRALKVMHPQYARDEASRARFAQEARAGARIKSEHVVEVVAAGVDDETGIPWLAMELLDGEELSLRMQRAGRLPPGEVLELFRQLGHGLGEAHRLGLVHRDLKPENLFIAVARRESAPFTLKILDFGVAKLMQESQTQTEGTRPVGTPRWMAPEQSEERAHITPATDVWAMGLLAYYLLTGRYYWNAANGGGSLTQLLRELVLEPIEAPSVRAAALGLGPAIPPGFDAWFAKCVVRETPARFPDASAALRALIPLLENAPAWNAVAVPVLGSARPNDEAALGDSGDSATRPPDAGDWDGQTAGAPTSPREDPRAATPSRADARASTAPRETASQEAASPAGRAASASAAHPRLPAERASAPSSAPPSRAGLAIAVAAALLIAVSGALWLRARSAHATIPTPAPAASLAAKPPAPPEPALDTFPILFESLPSGADVFEGEHKLGTTPLQLTLDNGPLAAAPRSFRIVKDGYQPYSMVQGPSREAVKVLATLGPLEPSAAKAEEPAQRPAHAHRREAEPGDEPELRLRR